MTPETREAIKMIAQTIANDPLGCVLSVILQIVLIPLRALGIVKPNPDIDDRPFRAGPVQDDLVLIPGWVEMLNDPTAKRRVVAMRALAIINSQDSRPILARCLYHPWADMRMDALETIQDFHVDELMDEVETVSHHDDDESIRQRAAAIVETYRLQSLKISP